MDDRLRVIGHGLRLAVRAGGWRLPVIVGCNLAIALHPSGSALALRAVTDGALDGDWTAVTVGVGGLALLTAVMFSAYGIWVPLETTVSERAGRLFEQDMMRLVASIPTLEPHERPDFADRIEQLRSNSQVLIGAVWTMVSNVSFVVGSATALILLVSAAPILLVLPLFGLPLLLASAYGVRMRERAVERTTERQRTASHLFDIATAQRFGKELRMSRLYDEVAMRHDRLSRDVNRERFISELGATGLSVGGWALFTAAWAAGIMLVAYNAVRGTGTPGDVVLVISVGALMQGHVSGAVNLVRELGQTLVMAARYVWLLDVARGTRGGDRPAPVRLASGIRFEQVSFTYPGTDVEVLHDVSVDLPAGATIAIVGDNGAGKSTLAKLLLGLYQPTSGRILVDGTDLAQVDPVQWRAVLSGAFQDFAKLEFVVRESVGVSDLVRIDDHSVVQRALERAGATAVPSLEQQLGSTWEGGVDLSGGQWQQVAVAREGMRRKVLVRVLDEPTAALDADTEHALFERYRDCARQDDSPDTVTVFISHRFSTVRMTDLILVLRDGRIVEYGSHDDLLRANGIYADLFSLQARAYR